MTTDLRIVIDVLTCEKYGVDPVQYRKALMASERFREAEVAIFNHNSLEGDYSQNGALMQMEFFGGLSDPHAVYALAREIFQKQKGSA